jgi:hypothetical protein
VQTKERDEEEIVSSLVEEVKNHDFNIILPVPKHVQ